MGGTQRHPDLVAVLAEGRRQGRPTLAITNEPGSPLAAQADMVIDIAAGEELGNLPGYVESVITDEERIRTVAADVADMRSCAVLGRGCNHSTASEWALKLQEVTYALAHPYSTADFRHGPIAVAEPGFPILAVAADGPLFDDMMQLLTEVTLEKHARTLVISNREEAIGVARFGIPLPAVPEWISPIPAIVAAQLFTYHLGTVKGLDTDQPRGLSKVTRTT